jgi:hypothetical protein
LDEEKEPGKRKKQERGRNRKEKEIGKIEKQLLERRQ